VSSAQTLGQPYNAGLGYEHWVRGVNPAGGANFSLALSGFARHRLIACVFTLTADANAANRYVTVEYLLDDNTPFLLGAAAVTVSANSTQRFAGNMYRGEAEWAANTDVIFPLLPIWLDGGWTLKINVAAIQAGDTLTLIRFLFDRFPTSDAAIPQSEG
jgi:hypothetical protein